jgi:hypothetical protein
MYPTMRLVKQLNFWVAKQHFINIGSNSLGIIGAHTT